MRRFRRLTYELLEARELLTTLSVYWSADQEPAGAAFSASITNQAASAIESRYAALLAPQTATSGLTADGSATQSTNLVVLGASAPFGEPLISPAALSAAGATADWFLQQHKATFEVQDVGRELLPLHVETDSLGMTHLRYQQLHQGVPVFGSEVTVHLGQDGQVASANGRLVSQIAVDTTPQVSQSDAVAKATGLFQQQFDIAANAAGQSDVQVDYAELCVLNEGLLENTNDPISHLAWEVNLGQVDIGASESFFVDARNGEVLSQLSETAYLHRNVVDTISPGGTTYRNRPEGAAPLGPNPMNGNLDADNIYDLLGFIHNDVLLANFGRDGGNGRGGIYNGSNNWNEGWDLTVAYTNLMGAYSLPAGAGFAPADGSVRFNPGIVAVDLVAHEYGHSIPFYSHFDAQGNVIGMVYQGESGALNEDWADAFGEYVEYYHSGSSDWLFGEDLPGGWRANLADPPRAPTSGYGLTTRYPDHYYSTDYYSGTADNGGVHIDSTIPTKAFYLLSVGGQFNGYQINSIGIDKAMQIWYRAVTQYYTPTETFNDAYYDLVQAATDLYGPADVAEVRKALQAVEMNLPRTGGPLLSVQNVTHTLGALPQVQVTFSGDVDASGLLAAPLGDGSIVQAARVVNTATGSVATTAEQFSYDSLTHTLTWSGSSPLPAGYYELQLQADKRLFDLTGEYPLWGGTGALEFVGPQLAAAQTLQAGGANLQAEGYSAPTLADWNADGRLDLVVGEKTAAGEGKVRVYLNTGTAQTPAYNTFFYAQAGASDLSVPAADSLGVSPRIADLNGDGLQDLVLGLADGTVEFWANVSTNADPRFATGSKVQAGPSGAKTNIDVGGRGGGSAAIELVDWNNDGRLDLLVGDPVGRVRLYVNQAAAGPPDFESERLLDDGFLPLAAPSRCDSISVADYNGDGRKDLVLGNHEGQVWLFANRGTDAAPDFDGMEAIQAGGATIDLGTLTCSRVLVADYNADGIPDLLVGAADGLVRLYQGTTAPGPVEGTAQTGQPGKMYVDTFYTAGPSTNLDADGNGTADALSDGILVLRYLFDPSGAWNVNDALGSGATRTVRETIKTYLDGGQITALDADGNGTADALSDGILILRYLFDPTGAWNVNDALGSGATRTTREAIKAYLDGFNPSPAPTASAMAGATADTLRVAIGQSLAFGAAESEDILATGAKQADDEQGRQPDDLRAVDTAIESWERTVAEGVTAGWMPGLAPVAPDSSTDDSQDPFWGEGDILECGDLSPLWARCSQAASGRR